MGANVIFTGPIELQPILKGNINLNCPNLEPEIMEFDWYVVFTRVCGVYLVIPLDSFRRERYLTFVF